MSVKVDLIPVHKSTAGTDLPKSPLSGYLGKTYTVANNNNTQYGGAQAEIVSESGRKPSAVKAEQPKTKKEAEKATSKSNPWKILAIICGVIAVVSLIALIVLFAPSVAVAVAVGALVMAKIGTGGSALFFGALAIGFGIKAHLVNKAQAEAV